MNKQEIYETVKTHLLTQNSKAQNRVDGPCQYRTADGKKCAIGCLIKDELYHSTLEGNSIYCKNVFDALSSSVELNGDLSNIKWLLFNLQTLHDDFPISDWALMLNKSDVDSFLKEYAEF